MDIFFNTCRLSDFEHYYKLKCDEKNIFWTGHKTLPKKNELLSWFEMQLESKKRDILLIKSEINSLVLGYIYLDKIDQQTIEIAYAIDSDFTGRGIGTSMIAQIKSYIANNYRSIKKIEAWVAYSNEGSKKCLLVNGWTETIEEKEAFFESVNKYVKMIKYNYYIYS